MELEEAKNELNDLLKQRYEEQIETHNLFEAIETVLQELENSVSKDIIREKIEELKIEYKKLENSSDFIIADTIQPKIQVLKELL